MSRDVIHLVRTWAAGEPTEPPARAEVTVRDFGDGDEPALRALTWVAYRGGVDEFPSKQAAGDEVSGCLAGASGPVVPSATLVAEAESALAAAAIVIRVPQYGLVPLLAFVATDPAYRGRGLATVLIDTATARLDGLGERQMHLAVTRGNPAERLYRTLGFGEPAQ